MREQEATAGGTIGKLTGRVKELAGTVLGRDDLHREGKLQQVQSEAEKDAATLAAEAKQKEGEAELEAVDLKQKARRAEEAASLIEHKGKG
jgi:uncharacterized protein YjbJ (UPF0337 family)